MAQINPPISPPLLVLFLLITTTGSGNAASTFFFLSYSQYKTVISLSQSLLTRVSNLRAERGDIAGAIRAKSIADKLDKGFWGLAWSVGYDYLKNYSWRELDYRELYGVVSDLKELAYILTELTRSESDLQRASWVSTNYSNVLRIAKSFLRRFLKVFNRAGTLREVAEAVQKEVMDGELLRDCIELGGYDLKGLVQIVKDLASQFYSGSTSDYHDTDL